MSDNQGLGKLKKQRSSLLEGLATSIGFILLSEIGDKTFFFIAVYAGRMKWTSLMMIACIAMFGMHISGVVVGGVFQFIISNIFLKVISSIMFFGFGISILYEGFTEDDEEDLSELYNEAEKEISEKEFKCVNEKTKEVATEHNHSSLISKSYELFKYIITSHALRVIFLIVAEEMGDRSQITAIALSSTYDFYIVSLGGAIGHFIAICIAISFGKVIAHYLNEKMLNYIGGT